MQRIRQFQAGHFGNKCVPMRSGNDVRNVAGVDESKLLNNLNLYSISISHSQGIALRQLNDKC